MNVFLRLHLALRHKGRYVIADGRDNSITLSPALVGDMRRHIDTSLAHVLMFTTVQQGRQVYGFTINPAVSAAEGVLPVIKHNAELHCTGFESLCPTVNRLLYDYRLPAAAAVLLHITTTTAANGTRYYFIQRT